MTHRAPHGGQHLDSLAFQPNSMCSLGPSSPVGDGPHPIGSEVDNLDRVSLFLFDSSSNDSRC
jgi:hypothetical protein